MSTWQERFEQELALAEASRAANNEGRARVCARRAVGILISEYFDQEGIVPSGSSAYAGLQQLISLPDISDPVRQVAGHFLARVTQEHQLSVEADLITEARWLATELLAMGNDESPHE